MNHLDEGTIHAWLDGALDSTQGREIEAHVAQCATCSAAVAEARGFVAAASRILNALDDVPANVVPKRVPVAPTAQRQGRQWRAAPWVTGIAAALIVAIGLTQVNRKGAPERVFMPATSSSLADSVTVLVERPTAAPAAPVQPPPQARSVPTTPTGEGQVAAVAEQPERRDQARDERQSASRDMARRSEPASDAQATGSRVATVTGAAESASPQSVPAMPSQRLQSRLSPQKLEEVVVTGARDAMKSVVTADVAMDAKAQVERLAGCYRLDAPTSVRSSVGNVAGAGGAAVQRAAKARAQVSEAPAAARYAAPAPPDIVQLDSVQKPLGYVVRAGGSDSSTIGWWSRFGGDTVQVRLLSGIAITLASRNRVSCPER